MNTVTKLTFLITALLLTATQAAATHKNPSSDKIPKPRSGATFVEKTPTNVQSHVVAVPL